ncbi:MAG: Do family serine endopeptidase [Cellvibrio sp.]
MLRPGSKFLGLIVIVLQLFAVRAYAANLPEFTELIEKNSPAVVKITTLVRANSRDQLRVPPQQNYPFPQDIPDIFRELFERHNVPERDYGSMGSGFIISEDGYVLTNHHVVDAAHEITVRMIDQREFKAELVGSDQRSDLALLKIDAKGLPKLKFAKPDSLKVGEWVVAIGSPFGLDYSASAGIVSATGRNISARNESSYVPFIQTDVAINPGNSGGPLFNLKGEVVGINSQIYTRSGGSIGLSFAIPSSVAEEVVQQLKDKGRVDRGWLGVAIQEVNRDLASSLGLDKPTGALVADVEPDGPAAKAGIKAGDLIIKFNGRNVNTQADLPYLVGRTLPNTKVPVVVIRKGKEQTIRVTIGVLPEPKMQAAAPSLPGKKPSTEADALGLVVEDVPDTPGQTSAGGVIVRYVEPNSPAAQAGLMVGDIIDQLGFNEVGSVESYHDILATLEKRTPQAIRFLRNGRPVFHTITLR